MKRNLRKYLSGMLSALLFVACILTPVNAHASSGLAVSAGKNPLIQKSILAIFTMLMMGMLWMCTIKIVIL